MINPKLLDLLICPLCGSALRAEADGLACAGCSGRYDVLDGVPMMLPGIVTRQSKKQIGYFTRENASRPGYRLAPWQKNYLENRILPGFGARDYRGKLLIDVGTGSGYCAVEFAKMGATVVACDLTPAAVLSLKKTAERLSLDDRILPMACSAEALPVKNGSFDFFILNAILEHLPDDARCLEEVKRITKKESRGFAVVPLSLKYGWPFFWPLNYFHDQRIGHLRRYDQESLAEKFGRAGFGINRVFYSGHLRKTMGVIFSRLTGIRRWEAKYEEWDRRGAARRFGANNISVWVEKKH